MTHNEIQTIREIRPWTPTSFHGNRKTFRGLPVSLIKEIVAKKVSRELARIEAAPKSPANITRTLLADAKLAAGTPYAKIMIEGNTGIYYASPVYRHGDYNKSRLFDKTPETLRLMNIFNSLVK